MLIKRFNKMDESKDILVSYWTPARCNAGWRQCKVLAKAIQISEKRCKVISVLAIDDDYNLKLAGYIGNSNRQKFNATTVAEREEGKIKNLSSLTIEEE